MQRRWFRLEAPANVSACLFKPNSSRESQSPIGNAVGSRPSAQQYPPQLKTFGSCRDNGLRERRRSRVFFLRQASLLTGALPRQLPKTL
ncbi:hypothetical protein NDU88_002188 [Pleurodeles waltl]|uniref:Uncharacterized protein n=1 Tax=Pleurodeles waltl TaxID=8319 RepID=A0AAV7TL89_PLEWA|nr:hypothetical protein NDU88_002188 [Pleurodeles waltl]